MSARALVIGADTIAGGSARDGFGSTDRLVNIETVRGSDFSDYMRGSDRATVREFFDGDAGNETIDGGAGLDFASYSSAALVLGGVNAFIQNGSGTVTDPTGGIDTLSNIEGLNGTNSNDTLSGGAGDQWFRGRGGSDTINGGADNDWVSYSPDPEGVIVNLGTGSITVGSETIAGGRVRDGWNGPGGLLALGGIDTLTNIENVEGSDYDDVIVGSSGANIIRGRAGEDTLEGLGGSDTLDGGNFGVSTDVDFDVASYDHSPSAVNVNLGAGTAADGFGGADTLIGIEGVMGSAFNDTLAGGGFGWFNFDHAEGFEGLAGNDAINGGDSDSATLDAAIYDRSPSAVNVNLGTGTASDGWGTTDTLVNINGAIGSAFNDTLVGGSADEWFQGGGGADSIMGGAGVDTVAFGDYSGNSNGNAGITANLVSGVFVDTHGNNDVVSGIENVIGSGGADSITGDGGDNRIEGKEGTDTLAGGLGTDTLSFRDSESYVTVNLSTLLSLDGSGSSDVISGFENVFGSVNNDTITGDGGANRLEGGLGNDTLTGGTSADTAADTLIGGEGNDFLRQTQGADVLDGGAGTGDGIDFTQTGVNYSGATGVMVNLATHVSDLNNQATGANATLVGIENVFGTSGNDVFIGGDIAHARDSQGNLVNEFFRPGAGNDTVTGVAGGNYGLTVDYSNNSSVQAVNINLGTGIVTDGLGGTDTLTNVTQVRGGAGNDVLTGGSLSRAGSGVFQEILRGNSGNDTINSNDSLQGGFGYDRADYSNNGSVNGIFANLTSTTITVAIPGYITVTLFGNSVYDGLAGIDTLFGIRQIHSGAGADTILGGTAGDSIDGGAGSDFIDGGVGSGDEVRYLQSAAGVIVNLSAGAIVVGSDTVAGGAAFDGFGTVDTLVGIENARGSDFNDYLRGSDEFSVRQRFDGDAGSDTIDGGAGIDFASYAGTALTVGGVNAFIENGSGTVSDPYGGTDTLINIEGLDGSNSNDTLSGGAGDQWFRGRGGSDTINGGADNDWVSYSPDPEGVIVNLGTSSMTVGSETVAGGTARDGWNGSAGLLALGGIDALTNIENVEGSDYDDLIVGSSGANIIRGRAGEDTLEGLGGNDTLDGGNFGVSTDVDFDVASYDHSPGAVNVNLGTGTAADGLGGTDTLLGIEGVMGSAFNDTLVGGGAGMFNFHQAEGFEGMAGNDTLNGGDSDPATLDAAMYEHSASAVNVNLDTGTVFDGWGTTDTLVNINGAIGSAFNDTLTGGGGDEWFWGGAGIDSISGGGGIDTLSYDEDGAAGVSVNLATSVFVDRFGNNDIVSGIENVLGGGNADSITGDDGNNVIEGSGGNDTLAGGLGIDTLFFRDSDVGVTVNLSTSVSLDGEGGSDVISGFENVIGSNNNDNITGDAGANRLEGGLGNDTLTGGTIADTTADTLIGGDGNDFLRQTQGADVLDGGLGFDTIDFSQTGVTYSGSTGVTVNLFTHVSDVDNNAAGTDATLVSIETVFGTIGNDSFTGGDALHAVDSTGSSITERFRPGAGNDTITGATGDGLTTTVDYSTNTSAQVVNVNLGTGIAVDGLGGNDTLFNVDQVLGGAGNDTITGGSFSRSASGAFFEIFRGNAGNDIINGGDNQSGAFGTDRADYSNSTGSVIANIGPSPITIGSISVAAGTVVDGLGGIDTLIDIYQIYGGSGHDTFIGGVGNDSFDGALGNDYLDGAGGFDEARFQLSTAAVIVNLDSNDLLLGNDVIKGGTARDGFGTIDTLVNIENVRGSDFGDYLRGSNDVNVRERFYGDLGDDTIDGGAGIDFAQYAPTALVLGGINTYIENGAGVINDLTGGTDQLINIEGIEGTNSNDTLAGGAGEQWFRGRGGNDTLNGGADSDWASYVSDPSGVIVNLGANAVNVGGETIGGGSARDGWDGIAGILGLGGTDTLISIENVEGSDFADVIYGNGSANALRGAAGNDTLDGAGGSDIASYGSSIGGVNINLASGVASDGFGTTDTLISIERIVGSDQNDTVVGSANADHLTGAAGDDTLAGVAGNDTLLGGLGNDTLDGGLGADSLVGGAGDDVYYVDDASDLVVETSSEGNDTVITTVSMTIPDNVENVIYVGPPGGGILGNALGNLLTGTGSSSISLNGAAGDDTIAGSVGDDTLAGGLDVDTVSYGYETNSVVVNLSASPVVVGVNSVPGGTADGSGTDTLSGFENAQGGSAADTLIGNNAANVLDGSAGADTLLGGFGNDIYVVDSVEDVVVETSNNPPPSGPASVLVEGLIDTVLAAVNWSLEGLNYIENVTLEGAATDATGNSLENVITGNELDNMLEGGTGNDTLDGEAGNDTLDGGTGIDELAGGTGNDTYVLDAIGDLVIERAGEGFDTIISYVAYALPKNVERLILIGVANVGAIGNDAFNTLIGNAGNNALDSGDGDDTLEGGVGADTLIGGLGDDSYILETAGAMVVEDAGGGLDRVYAGFSYVLGANLEDLTLTGAGSFNATGNALGNTLFGNEAANILDGEAGFDTMIGGGGNDTYRIGDAGDLVLEGPNGGTDIVESMISYTLAANVEEIVLTGIGHINASGNVGANVLSGNAGNNILVGGSGNDTVYGGDGADEIVGGEGLGDDVYYGGSGPDTVRYSSALNAVVVVLYAGTATGADIGSDLLFDIEDVIGGMGADVIVGDQFTNLLAGGAGNDHLYGQEGDDSLFGGDINDNLIGGAGADNLTGGADADLFYFGAADLQAGVRDTITDHAGGTTDLVRLDGVQYYSVNAASVGNGVLVTANGAEILVQGLPTANPLFVATAPVEVSPGTIGATSRANLQLTSLDWASNQTYSRYTELYNGNGQLERQFGAYDSGSSAGGSWDFLYDVTSSNAQYATRFDYFNASGQMFEQQGTYDGNTGSYIQRWDRASTQNYDTTITYYNQNGQPNQVQSFYDNSSGSGITTFDPTGAQSYSEYTTYYDTHGHADTQNGVYDTGPNATWWVDFYQDAPGDARDFLTVVYNSLGAVTQQWYTMDDGAIVNL